MLGKWRVNHYFKEKFQVHKNSSYFTITSHRGVILPETSMTISPAEIQGGHLPVYSAINKPTCVFACLILCFEHQMHQILISRRWEPCLLYILRKLSLAQKVLITVEMNSIPRRRWIKWKSTERRREIGDATWNLVELHAKSKCSGISQNEKKMWAKTETLTKWHARYVTFLHYC